MDILGHEQITNALAGCMRIGEYVRVVPDELEFNDYRGADKSMRRYDRVRYLDIITHALPSLVLNSLSECDLLADDPEKESAGKPRLQLVGIMNNGAVNILTFDDLSTP